MSKSTKAICRHLDVLGVVGVLVAILFFTAFFYNEDILDPVSTYFMGGGFSLLILSVMAFGFSKTY
ncbi:MAG: hypothetical protein R3318_03130, partial [Gammaproteobacteria bacterium]|nr:hypothetical protein [Gammaproteobacteria bacterium]